QRLQMGTLQHCPGLFGVQRSRRADARQAARVAGTLPVEAQKFNVFPLENSIIRRVFTPRPSAAAGRKVFNYFGKVSGIPADNAPSIVNRSYTITAEVDLPEDGGEGMIVTEGGRFGGYGLYLLKGKPVFLYNLLDKERFRWSGQEALAPGKHTIVFDFTC